jgi:predicted amidophosphoribosyltransferase
VILESPSTAAASFSLNFLTIGGIAAAVIAVGVSVLFLRRRGSRYPSLTTQPQPPAPAVCPSCGAPTNPALAFCENCGARLRQT